MKDEVVGQHGAAAREIAVGKCARELPEGRGHPPRHVAAGGALEHLPGGGVAIVGVEDDSRYDAALGVDFPKGERLDLEGCWVLGYGPEDVLERQPVA